MSVGPTSTADGTTTVTVMSNNFLQWTAEVTVLFRSWKTENNGMKYFFTLLAVFLLAMLYQRLSHCRSYLKSFLKEINVSADPSRATVPEVSAGDNVASNLEGGTNEGEKARRAKIYRRKKLLVRLLVSLVIGINVALGYLIALCVMSFNVGIFLAVVFGITVADVLSAVN